MELSPAPEKALLPWKAYLYITFESLLTFYLATFCIAMYFLHRGENWVIGGVFLGILYAFVVFVCAQRVIRSLPLAALMLVIPIAPFLALAIVLSLIPLLQYFA